MATNGDLARWFGNKPKQKHDDFVRVGADGKIDTDLIPAAKGLIVKATNDTTVDSWDIPQLTIAEVTALYDAFHAGYHCAVQTKNGKVTFAVVNSDETAGKSSILIQYYWLGYVDYQVGTSAVTVTTHKFTA